MNLNWYQLSNIRDYALEQRGLLYTDFKAVLSQRDKSQVTTVGQKVMIVEDYLILVNALLGDYNADTPIIFEHNEYSLDEAQQLKAAFTRLCNCWGQAIHFASHGKPEVQANVWRDAALSERNRYKRRIELLQGAIDQARLVPMDVDLDVGKIPDGVLYEATRLIYAHPKESIDEDAGVKHVPESQINTNEDAQVKEVDPKLLGPSFPRTSDQRNARASSRRFRFNT